MRWTAIASLCLLATFAVAGAACGGRVRLDLVTPAGYHFGTPLPVSELASSARRDNPTLTGDLLEIYFTTKERSDSGGGDVWVAKRSNRNDPFGTPGPVDGAATSKYETSSAISADGLTLWFGSDQSGGAGGIDIWFVERPNRESAWSSPSNMASLNTSADEIPRPPGQHGLVMPMASTKDTPSGSGDRVYQSYFAKRSNQGAPFQNATNIPGLGPDRLMVDGFLSDDGLTFFFNAVQDGASLDGGPKNADLFVALRTSTDEAFSITQPLTDLNTEADERDPWLSPDGSMFYFTTDRSGDVGIWSAPVLPR
jgi:hypothetical protein